MLELTLFSVFVAVAPLVVAIVAYRPSSLAIARALVREVGGNRAQVVVMRTTVRDYH